MEATETTSLKLQIKSDTKIAMRAKEILRRDTLRNITAAIKQVEIDEQIEASNERVCQIMHAMIKKRTDAIEQYIAGRRDDLVSRAQREIAVISEYLPEQLSDEDLSAEVAKIIADLGAAGIADLGKVMQEAKARIGVSAPAQRISQEAKKQLS